jgi:hypothetical protein
MKLTKLGLGLFVSSTMIAPTTLVDECRVIERLNAGMPLATLGPQEYDPTMLQ